jgi:uncharacterized membrane protein
MGVLEMPRVLPQYAFQIGIAITLWLLIVNARREGHRWLGTLLWGIAFGFAVEYVNVHNTPPFYQYPACNASSDTVCVGGVSLWVPVGWGEILYLSTWTAQRLRMRWYVRPLAAAFLAVNLDLSLDPTAQRLHLWTWAPPYPQAGAVATVTVRLFDIPFDNFLGWYMIVFLYALSARGFLRLSARWTKKGDGLQESPLDFFMPMLAAIVAFGGYMLVKHLATSNTAYHGDDGSMAGKIFIGVAAVVGSFTWLHAFRSRRDHEANWAPLAIPVAFHALCFVLVVACGAWKEQPGILVTIPMNMVLGFVLHVWPSLDEVFASMAPRLKPAPVSFIEPRGPYRHHPPGLDDPEPHEFPGGEVGKNAVAGGESTG